MSVWGRRALLLLALLVIVGGAAYMMRPIPVMVDGAEIGSGPMLVTVDEEGKTRIRERYVISSPLRGRLRRITLDPGDGVRALETPVAFIEPAAPTMLDPRAVAESEARVRAAEAGVRRAASLRERARADYDFAERELGRVASAGERGAANPRELEQARTAERVAAEGLRAAEHDEEIAEFELDVARSALLYAKGEAPEDESARMTLASPVDGVVLRVHRESVVVVEPGEPLLEVGDPSDLEIVIDVLSADGVRIRPGDRVIVEDWGGDHPLEARVRLIEPSAYMHVSALGIEEQRVDVIADFVSPRDERAGLGDAFRIEARIVVWSDENTLQVPSSALYRMGESWGVFVIVGGRAEARRVEIGRRNSRFAQALGGLRAGERVVLHPSDRLSDGVRVREREPDHGVNGGAQ